MKILIGLSVFIACTLIPGAHAIAETDSEQALTIVESAPCNGQTVREALEHTFKKHSQRDLGWRVFDEDGGLDVERAILVNKGRQIRFRWRIDAEGNVTPISKKAKALCD